MSGLLTLIACRLWFFEGKSRISRPPTAHSCNMMYDMSAESTNNTQKQAVSRTEGPKRTKDRRERANEATCKFGKCLTVCLNYSVFPYFWLYVCYKHTIPTFLPVIRTRSGG